MSVKGQCVLIKHAMFRICGNESQLGQQPVEKLASPLPDTGFGIPCPLNSEFLSPGFGILETKISASATQIVLRRSNLIFCCCYVSVYLYIYLFVHLFVHSLIYFYFQASVNATDQLGRQTIHLAAQAGCISSVEYLITYHGVDVNVCTGKSQMIPLHLAAKVHV